MLSEENRKKINWRGLYKMEPERVREGTYWCKNWTFVPRRITEDAVFMYDTYYGDSHCIPITDENFDKFEYVFDFDKVERISDKEFDEYDEADLYCVATDSGGSYCGGLYWKNKGASKSKSKQIEKLEHQIKSLKSDIEWKQQQLAKLYE